MGDFKSPLSTDEKRGEALEHTIRMDDLAEFISQTNLLDLKLSGNHFTRSNKRHGNNIIQ
ncbi:hypothetical protein KI387_030063, partial [Taxus chinensis]